MSSPSPGESIFFHALSKTDPAERAAYLDEACGDDAELRRRVERLLAAYPGAGGFLEQPAVDRPDVPAETETVPPAVPDEPPLDFLAPSQKPGSLGRLDHYEILERVGRGGMGVVLKAFDEKLHRVVAIKVLAPELAAHGTARQRFTREARAAAAVCHEHVVTIHAVEENHRPPYLVMQFVSGISLQDRLDRDGVLPLPVILRVGLQTALGLAAAHRQGLVHRDIKPANILLENSVERVKITDFGLARAADDASLTQSGTIAGTPLYMSPEQAAGEPIDHRSDLFSLGSVLYALCTGRPPFRASGTHAVLRRVIDDTPRPIAEVNPVVPAWLCALVARLHAKQPADRYQTADEVADVLGRHLAGVQRQRPETAPPRPRKRASAGSGRRLFVWFAVLLVLAVPAVAATVAARVLWNAPRAEPTAPERAEEKPTVPPEVLTELRKLVEAQDQTRQLAEVQYQQGRVSRLDVCLANSQWLEARIRLAEAEQQPVVPLLEQLQKNTEEEVAYTQAMVHAGRSPTTDLLASRSRLADVRTRLARARAAAP